MMRLKTAALLTLLAAPALAVQPMYWRTTSAEEFLTGEFDGMTVTSRGELRPGPDLELLGTVSDPFVLSQVTGADGTIYIGTGNGGKVYAVRSGEPKLLFTAAEPEIYALAMWQGSLLVGSSPNGKLYRVDPATGKSTVLADPQQAYIWAIAPLRNGDVALATGVEGRVLRVRPDGTSSVLYDAPEAHVRSLIAVGDRLIAGGSGEGRIYEIDAQGRGRALFDSPLSEIAALAADRNGIIWAAGAANILPAAAPARTDSQKGSQQQQQQQQQQQGGEAKQEESAGVEVSFSFDDQSATATAPGGSAELYRIDTDGYVDTVRRFDREIVYALAPRGDGRLLIGTGPLGRLYRYDPADREIALVATVPQKQIASIAPETMTITTTNSGAIYRVAPRQKAAAEFRSAVKDAARFSRYGAYSLEGRNLTERTVRTSFRSGNTNTPDDTWSSWISTSGKTGESSVPAARYVQWRVETTVADVVIESVTLAFVNRNVAPVLDNVTVQDPGAVFISANYPSSPQVLEATNPDEYGIFTSLEPPRERTEPGKKFYRKGYRSVTWKGIDENGDTLLYSVHFRQQGSSEWLRLREKIEESQINFDTSQLPDGVYELRITASDERDNPEMPLQTTKEGYDFLVDNSAPSVAVSRTAAGVVVDVRDDRSPVGKVEYAADAEKWVRLVPVDGIADSKSERFLLPREAAGKFVVIRATDTFANVTTAGAN